MSEPDHYIAECLAGNALTEYSDGWWRRPGASEAPEAVITYATKPSPETGHVGWCWWARGLMGRSTSYMAARREAGWALRQMHERDLVEAERARLIADLRAIADSDDVGIVAPLLRGIADEWEAADV